MEQKAERLKRGLILLLIFLLLLAAIFMIRGYLEGYFCSVETLQTYIATFGVLAPLMLALIQAIQVIVPVLPGILGCIAGAGMFGAAGGFWCNYIGISAGSIIAFFLARKFGMELVKRMLPVEKYQSWIQRVSKKRSYTVILWLAILLPMTPDDFLCYFSGLGGMSAKRFVWIILLGKPWCILAYSIFFAYFI